MSNDPPTPDTNVRSGDAANADTDVESVERAVRTAVAGLDALGIEGAAVIDCDPALADTAEFCAAYGYDLADSANAIVVVGKSDPAVYVLAVVLASHRLDVNGVVRRTLGVKKASFAPAADTAALTGMQLGGVTPLAVPAGLPVWIDAAVMERRQIVVGGGSRSCKVVGPPAMLTALVPSACVIDDLAHPIPAE